MISSTFATQKARERGCIQLFCAIDSLQYIVYLHLLIVLNRCMKVSIGLFPYLRLYLLFLPICLFHRFAILSSTIPFISPYTPFCLLFSAKVAFHGCITQIPLHYFFIFFIDPPESKIKVSIKKRKKLLAYKQLMGLKQST